MATPEQDTTVGSTDLERAAVYENLPRNPRLGEPEDGPPRGYIGWSPGDDSLEAGWTYDTWPQFRAAYGDLDVDLNLVADFYFRLTHDSVDCEACEHTGYNAATARIKADLDMHHTDTLSDDEVAMLVAEHQLSARDFAGQEPTGELVRRAAAMLLAERAAAGWTWFGLGTSDRFLLAEHRARAAGTYGECDVCNGAQSVRTGPDRLQLELWMLHPRTGRSRGLVVSTVRPAELDDVKAYLAASFERHTAHFAWVTT